ncbi:MAG: hypothetical protein ACRDIA_07215, partial [Actinomycetota bacterium]
FSGADLKSIRNSAGMKALTRAALGTDSAEASVIREDFMEALAERGISPVAAGKPAPSKDKKRK